MQQCISLCGAEWCLYQSVPPLQLLCIHRAPLQDSKYSTLHCACAIFSFCISQKKAAVGEKKKHTFTWVLLVALFSNEQFSVSLKDTSVYL